MRTLGTTLDSQHNSLNALRLFLALLVIVSHAPLTGGFGEPFQIGDVEVGGWAVECFFIISGWLITGSRLHLDFLPFLLRRVLRIFPAFWVSLVAVAFAFAPLTVLFGGGEYRLGEALGFVSKNASLYVLQPTIEGSLVSSAYDSHWNLSLWTLRWEFLAYLGIAVLLGHTWTRARPWVVLAAFMVVAVPYAVVVAADVQTSAGYAQASRLGGCFLAGAVAYRFRTRIPVNRRWILAAVLVLVTLSFLHVVRGFGAVPLAYLTLWLGGTLPLQSVGRVNDISYGVYVYAFPLQLLLAVAGVPGWGLFAYTVVCLVVVLPLAWASWVLVEKPMLALKDVRVSRRRSAREPVLSTPREDRPAPGSAQSGAQQ